MVNVGKATAVAHLRRGDMTRLPEIAVVQWIIWKGVGATTVG